MGGCQICRKKRSITLEWPLINMTSNEHNFLLTYLVDMFIRRPATRHLVVAALVENEEQHHKDDATDNNTAEKRQKSISIVGEPLQRKSIQNTKTGNLKDVVLR